MGSYHEKSRVYSVICESLISEEGIEYTTYGILTSVGGEDIVISDITTDREALEDLVNRCNLGELDVIHLYDVVEDFLVI